MNINDLNDDCLKHIFSHLSLKDIIRSERVCKLWQELIEELLLVQICISAKNKCTLDSIQMQSLIIAKIINKCPNVKHIDLTSFNIDEHTIEVVANRCQRLEKFICKDSVILDDKLMDTLSCGRYAQQLTCVNVSKSSNVTESGFKCLLQSCVNLKAIDFSNNDNISGETSLQFLGPFVDSLNISKCRYIREAGFNSLVSGNGVNIKELKCGTYVSKKIINLLTLNMKSLKTLSIEAYYYPQSFTPYHLSPLHKLNKLEKLILHDLPLVKNCFDAIFLNIIKFLSKLKILSLRSVQISDNSLTALSKLCPSLESFKYQFSKYPNIINTHLTDFGIKSFTNLKSLRILSLIGTEIGDSVTQVILQNTTLQQIQLIYCVNVTQVTATACIHSLNSHRSKLAKVKIEGCKVKDYKTMSKSISQ